MINIRKGSIRLFRFAGIDLFLHWSWFLAAAYIIGEQEQKYSSLSWNVLEYLALFLIVMLHEFGHALACRQVGGMSDQIVLWPLGGVAYVNPPQRPGATLWSIAAGPLVVWRWSRFCGCFPHRADRRRIRCPTPTRSCRRSGALILAC